MKVGSNTCICKSLYSFPPILLKMRMATDIAKEKLDLTKAELDKEIRMHPESFDIAKITEAAVTAAIISHSKYKEANRNYLDAKYESDVSSAAVRAIDARKDALENLVRLHGQQYFAGPKIPRDVHWEREQKQAMINRAVSKRTVRSKPVIV